MLIPDPQALAAALATLIPTSATTKALTTCTTMLSLAIVAAKSPSDADPDRATALIGLLGEAAARVDGEANGAAALLLGIAPGTRGALPKERRRRACNALGVSLDHFRREREEPLLEAVADELYAADSAYRLRHKHRTEPERAPEDSSLRINWAEQHRSYRRIWTPVWGMRADLHVLDGYLEEKADSDLIGERICNLTWRYAKFRSELDQFIKREGGLWLLADAESEIAAADAMYGIGYHVPFGDMDNSWLRLLLSESQNEELDPFTDLILADETRWPLLAKAWTTWCTECDCVPEAEPSCERHCWEAAADLFIRLIDADWLRVADWYRTPRTHPWG